ncbi:hypothetical protein P389DRAFT_191986 [Cystobasidium minutum MCA 4210]|uniref:uncharacterized protein n=1 Tax=Cystobasidium minutum MCA 4210 TaxID=1397322 RepID=UPI0034CFC842|eukprot:jgi/Rhomi1/191986/gm1.200_g
MFVIVAVSDDYSPLVSSKTFFYFAFIFFPFWMILIVMGLEINLWTGTREFAYLNF